MVKHYNCIVCSKRTKPKERRSINPAVKRLLQNKWFITNISQNDIICNGCMHKYYNAEKSRPLKVTRTTQDDCDQDFIPPKVARTSKQLSSPPSVCLNIPGASNSHARCVVCKTPGPKFLVVSSDARVQAFIDGNVLIPAGARCCSSHFQENGFLKTECFDIMSKSENSSSNRTSIVKLLTHMRETCQKTQNKIDFDNIGETDCKNLTGLFHQQFEDLCLHVLSHIKTTPSRTPKTSVGLFLIKMKCALSNKLMSTLFKVIISSVRRAINTVRQAFMRSFVPLYLGFESITREQIIKDHIRPLAKTLLDADNDNMILVLDGTYIYIQKSNNFSFQRKSFSLHKSRSLVKPMVVVSTTGHFVAILDPYLSRNNDASILNHMMKCNVDDVKSFVNDKDIFVVDRGFRDSITLLEELGIKAAMPTFMKKGEKQMSDADANTNRMVTKVKFQTYIIDFKDQASLTFIYI
ncbi:unnamed protein product [Mytilus coruscus]|uniref:DDE Tnp4 domain-containing protein n=1 Tax=Mytilus coruscus TaxID=42192 RepID=A0A6J8A3Q8_MYTCO|nr:unnamed protein product [Mytilus coruscus]